MPVKMAKWGTLQTHSIETLEKLAKIVRINFVESLENSERFTATKCECFNNKKVTEIQ